MNSPVKNKFVVAYSPNRAVAVNVDYAVWGGNGKQLYEFYQEAKERFNGKFQDGDCIPFNNSFMYLCDAYTSMEAINRCLARLDEQFEPRR